jgi:extradiol dioxygenase family protein
MPTELEPVLNLLTHTQAERNRGIPAKISRAIEPDQHPGKPVSKEEIEEVSRKAGVALGKIHDDEATVMPYGMKNQVQLQRIIEAIVEVAKYQQELGQLITSLKQASKKKAKTSVQKIQLQNVKKTLSQKKAYFQRNEKLQDAVVNWMIKPMMKASYDTNELSGHFMINQITALLSNHASSNDSKPASGHLSVSERLDLIIEDILDFAETSFDKS